MTSPKFRTSRERGYDHSQARVPIRIPELSSAGYLLTEALVYIGLVFLLLGIGSAAMYRCIDNSVALRRNADDIARAVHAGELWRADIRAATRGISLENREGEAVLQLDQSDRKVEYRSSDKVIYRRVGSGSWTRILEPIKTSSMQRDARTNVIAWRWELELQPKAHGSFKPGSVRPLFTFLAVPNTPGTP